MKRGTTSWRTKRVIASFVGGSGAKRICFPSAPMSVARGLAGRGAEGSGDEAPPIGWGLDCPGTSIPLLPARVYVVYTLLRLSVPRKEGLKV